MKTNNHSIVGSYLLAGLGLLLASSGLAVLTGVSAGAEPPIHKSYVCKYVQKPGAFELLQGGGNPIWVDNHAMTGKDAPVKVGDRFSDGQILSVVIVANTAKLDPEPTVADCPTLEPPPPTEVTAAAPAFRNPTCPAPTAGVVLPTTEGVTFTQSGPAAPGATVTVTAVAQPGFVLTGQTTWQHTFAPVPTNCAQVLPPENPPVQNPPEQNPPVKNPPAVSPPAAAPPVTPEVVRAGSAAPVASPIAPEPALLGLGLLAVGLLLLTGAGVRSLARTAGGR